MTIILETLDGISMTVEVPAKHPYQMPEVKRACVTPKPWNSASFEELSMLLVRTYRFDGETRDNLPIYREVYCGA
jgi:hypothetical protein